MLIWTLSVGECLGHCIELQLVVMLALFKYYSPWGLVRIKWMLTGNGLAAAGSKVMMFCHSRRSPLHMCASSSQYMECMMILVEHGAKIRMADCNGIRPIDLHEVNMCQCLIVTCCVRVLRVAKYSALCSFSFMLDGLAMQQ